MVEFEVIWISSDSVGKKGLHIRNCARIERRDVARFFFLGDDYEGALAAHNNCAMSPGSNEYCFSEKGRGTFQRLEGYPLFGKFQKRLSTSVSLGEGASASAQLQNCSRHFLDIDDASNASN
jgi:hypothetical protein